MLVTQQKVLRRFWYPIVPLAHLADGPMPFTLLGTDIALWLTEDGAPAAVIDRCIHRSARLSGGRCVAGRIECGYHGWLYDASGRLVRLPQRGADKQDDPPRIAIDSYRTAVRYGYVWVCLDEPLADIPELEEAEDPAFRFVDEFYEEWGTSGLRVMENSFDNAHFSYVHQNSFGILDEPEPASMDIRQQPWGFLMVSDVPVKNPELQKNNLKIDGDRTLRHNEKTWFMPFSRKMRIRYPNGLVHTIFTAATPIDDRRSQLIQFAYRNDSEAETPAETVVAFDRQVTIEDKTILEQCDYDVPLDLSDKTELHMRSDRPGIEMRKRLGQLLAEHGEAEIRRNGAVAMPDPPRLVGNG